jgi:hypothetical protein
MSRAMARPLPPSVRAHRPLWRITGPAFWRTDPTVTTTLGTLREIPDGATVAATNGLAAQLTGRCRVRLIDNDTPAAQNAEWVVADTSAPGFSTAAALADRLAALRAAGYRDVPAPAPVVLLHRPTAPPTMRPAGSPGP